MITIAKIIEALDNCADDQKKYLLTAIAEVDYTKIGIGIMYMISIQEEVEAEETRGQNSMEDDINEGHEAARGRA